MWFINPLVMDKEIWFCEGEHSVVLKYDRDTKSTKMAARLPGENLYGFMRYNMSTCYGNTMLAIPQYGDELLLYDRCRDSWKSICQVRADKETLAKYVSAVNIDHYAVLIPWHQKSVLVYDYENGKVSHIRGWYEEVCSENDDRDLFAGNAYCFNDQLYLPFCEYPYILVVDPRETSYRLIKLHRKDTADPGGNSGIVIMNDTMFLCSRRSEQVSVYDLDGKMISKICSFPEAFHGGGKVFSDMIYQNEKFWLFPDEANMILSIEMHKDAEVTPVLIRGLTEADGEIKKRDTFTAYKPFVYDGDHIAFLIPGQDYLFFLNTLKGSVQRESLDDGMDENGFAKMISENSILQEDNYIDLPMLIRNLD